MNFEDLQSAWQSQNTAVKVTVNADLLLREVQRNARAFRATIFWRDVREIGVAAFLTWLFLHWGIRDGEWTLCVLAFACFGVGAFMLLDRWLQHCRKPATNNSLQSCVGASLAQVTHQIWLLKNVFWWYLLPIEAGLGLVILSALWHSRDMGVWTLLFLGGYAVFCALLCWGIYWLNQFAVRKELEPRRKDLEELLATLRE